MNGRPVRRAERPRVEMRGGTPRPPGNRTEGFHSPCLPPPTTNKSSGPGAGTCARPPTPQWPKRAAAGRTDPAARPPPPLVPQVSEQFVGAGQPAAGDIDPGAVPEIEPLDLDIAIGADVDTHAASMPASVGSPRRPHSPP